MVETAPISYWPESLVSNLRCILTNERLLTCLGMNSIRFSEFARTSSGVILIVENRVSLF